ncbi:MAG: hypothetical protein KZQ66_00500, partial [Candidatus Thiodiazotropha sp. (ex Lucinoma aequizonata)]|nr:hypothetical protein [Candidatus Thiodiazotropha sp. (ex Lucinoma aequizonata)]MCU7896719.1 hypothetical protein [Candidatus Thiodiazotropha sp. (ex Lucinoma aequizonata)]MCU7900676.1 hypothetical protein [Candidatus Thiodiazotropha sp. (ex Lucinoma aequizonata)]MCU7913407.1 hypothetical protein [Candidatus Thiodiazotropha sp. (ex Lucinoma aequizonata)]
SLSVAIPAIQPRLRLSGTNRLRSAFHGDQRLRSTKFLDHVNFPPPHYPSSPLCGSSCLVYPELLVVV